MGNLWVIHHMHSCVGLTGSFMFYRFTCVSYGFIGAFCSFICGVFPGLQVHTIPGWHVGRHKIQSRKYTVSPGDDRFRGQIHLITGAQGRDLENY